jgi:HSP20 family protein
MSENADPFQVMRREMNRLFDDVFGDFGVPSLSAPGFRQMPSPKIDVSETEKELRIAAELPGVKEDDIEVMLDEDSLTIRGEIKEERDDQDKDRNYHVKERVEGAFSRTLPLPFRVDPGKVHASFANGVLTITMPKPEETQQKRQRIEVQRSSAGSSQSGQGGAGSTASPGRERPAAGSSSGSSAASERAKETAG